MSDGMLVGIDGGGSKTLVAAADSEGTVTMLVRGRATSPFESSTWASDLAAQVATVARSSGRMLAAAAALPSYGEVEQVSASQRQVVAGIFGAVPQRVLNDVDAAHLGAFAGGPGILVLSGTGSMAWARDDSGNSIRTGGWGEVIGDEGSGFWVGRRVLEAVSKSLDGRADPTELADAVFERLGLDLAGGASRLEAWAFSLTSPRTQIADLARIAVSLAARGEPAARTIVAQAADEIASHARALEIRLGPGPTDWSYAGGMFSSAAFLAAVTDRIGRPPVRPRLPPIGGALLAAAQHLGLQPDAGWIDRLSHSIGSMPARPHEHQPAG